MKKCILMALCACLLLSLFGSAVAESDAAPLRVVSTIFPPYDFVREIAGDRVELSMLLSPGSESHSFEPSPQNIITIQDADVFIYVGGDSDQWVQRILESMDTSEMTLLALTDIVETVAEEPLTGIESEHDHDHDHDDEEEAHDDHDHEEHEHEEEHEHTHEFDEHVWTSPQNAMMIVSALCETLSTLDAENAALYQENTEVYLSELQLLDTAFQEAVDSGSRNVVLFGDRFPFRYLADAYGLEYYAAFPGCATETEASASTIAFLIDTVEEQALPAVFTIEFSNGKIADVICESTGAEKLLMHSCHNVSRDDFDAGIGYLDLMHLNAQSLKEALQ